MPHAPVVDVTTQSQSVEIVRLPLALRPVILAFGRAPA